MCRVCSYVGVLLKSFLKLREEPWKNCEIWLPKGRDKVSPLILKYHFTLRLQRVHVSDAFFSAKRPAPISDHLRDVIESEPTHIFSPERRIQKMKFREALELLRDTGNDPILLRGHQPGKEVLCAPTLVGRVLSSTFEAASGESLGWIGEEAIQSGPADPVFNNFGGDRLWFGPEGSQFGLLFGQDQSSQYRSSTG
jgi:hypothetical protein